MARPTTPIPTFIINLQRDELRRKQMISQFVSLTDFDVRFIEAIPAEIIAESVRRVLAQDVEWANHKGTLGCFLSHVKAWEAIAAASSPFGIVLEDDVEVAGLRVLKEIDLPQDAEIIFLNDRMSPQEISTRTARVVPLWHALRRLNQLQIGPGGDGYLLTPRSAAILVSACLKDFYFGHVDGRLLRYAASETDLEMAGEGSWVVNVIRKHHHSRLIPKLGLLRGYCLSKPLVRHVGLVSTREAADSTAIIWTPKQTAVPCKERVERASSFLPIRYWNRVENIGDLINPFVIEDVSGKKTFFSFNEENEHILGIGSIFFMANQYSHIWGTGIMDPTRSYNNIDPTKVHAVRGGLTRDILFRDYELKREIPVGDPGVFVCGLPEIMAKLKDIKVKRKIGIIPHYSMARNPIFADLAKQIDGDVLSPRSRSLDLVTEIAASEMIISQSLHGLIFAEALGVPSAWIAHTVDDIWSFKFKDWYTNTVEPPKHALAFSASPEQIRQAARLSGLKIDVQSLRNALPMIDATANTSPTIGFRETRNRPTYVCWISDSGNPGEFSSRYDFAIACQPGDDESLRIGLNEQAKRFAEPPNVLLVFDNSLFSALSEKFIDALTDIMSEFPDTHFVSVLGLHDTGAIRSKPLLSSLGLPLHKFEESFRWQGVVLARHPVNFSFSAPGYAVFQSPERSS